MSHYRKKKGYECNFMYELTHTKSFSINVTCNSLVLLEPLHLCLCKTDLSLRIRADMIADFVADVFCL